MLLLVTQGEGEQRGAKETYDQQSCDFKSTQMVTGQSGSWERNREGAHGQKPQEQRAAPNICEERQSSQHLWSAE